MEDRKWNYDQPQEVLDLAWDRFMELGLEQGPEGFALSIHLKLEPPEISRLFDIAITAYRQHTQGEKISPETMAAAREEMKRRDAEPR